MKAKGSMHLAAHEHAGKHQILQALHSPGRSCLIIVLEGLHRHDDHIAIMLTDMICSSLHAALITSALHHSLGLTANSHNGRPSSSTGTGIT